MRKTHRAVFIVCVKTRKKLGVEHMKVIFLDIDGVLNNSYTEEKIDQYIFVEDRKIELLKRLMDNTGAKIVLTSTWRHGWPELKEGKMTQDVKLFLALQNKLLEFDIEILDYTPITNGAMNKRGEEIDAWLKEWQGEAVESFVILDDLSGVYLRPHSKYLVQTSFMKGLEEKHIYLAEKILKVQ